MKTDRELLQEYGVTLNSHNVIAELGKFEHEPIETLYYYDAMLNGDGEDLGDMVKFEVSEKEKIRFTVEEKYFYLEVSDEGFVSGEFSDKDYEAIESEVE